MQITDVRVRKIDKEGKMKAIVWDGSVYPKGLSYEEVEIPSPQKAGFWYTTVRPGSAVRI